MTSLIKKFPVVRGANLRLRKSHGLLPLTWERRTPRESPLDKAWHQHINTLGLKGNVGFQLLNVG